MWIGIGTYAIIDSLAQKNRSKMVVAAVVLFALLLVPVNMAWSNIPVYSRAGK